MVKIPSDRRFFFLLRFSENLPQLLEIRGDYAHLDVSTPETHTDFYFVHLVPFTSTHSKADNSPSFR